MMNYQPPSGRSRGTRLGGETPFDESAGAFVTLGVFALFAGGTLTVSFIAAQFGDSSPLFIVLLGVAPTIAAIIAYQLRSWWWVLYTTLAPVLGGIVLLFGNDFTAVLGIVCLILGIVNVVAMTIVTVISQSKDRSDYTYRPDRSSGLPDRKKPTPSERTPLTEW